MYEDYTIQELSLTFSYDKDRLIHFLAEHDLKFEDNIEMAYGVVDSSDQLVGCGCCARNILKCFAVDETLRGHNILGSLISKLVENRFQTGFYELFVITRPSNRSLFTSCGFYPLAETASVLMLENKKNGLEQYYRRQWKPCGTSSVVSQDSSVGCIIMNCNPFTNGHLALIEYAASHCSTLHIFVVEENRSEFPFEIRIRLVKEGTKHLSNVLVHPSGPYIISSATFPTYFLKSGEDAAMIQSELDITLFASRIAPIFGIRKRFAGDEPLDPITNKYNLAMRHILPKYHIEFSTIERKEQLRPDGQSEVISASRVRSLLHLHGVDDEVLSMVPSCTASYLLHEYKGD